MLKTLNGISMNYELKGPKKAPVLVFVHGFPFSQALWAPQVAALSKDYQILTYDLRGMGKTALGKAPQLLESYVDDLFALLEHLKIGSAALIGLSMGGYIALRAIERHGSHFWALVLADSRADADSDEIKLNRAAGIKSIRAKGAKAFAAGMLPKLLCAETLGKNARLVKELGALMGATPADGMCNALAAMASRTDTHMALRRFASPVLAIAGKHDLIAPPNIMAAMAKEAEKGDFEMIAGAGHVSNLENSRAFNDVLARFLKRAQFVSQKKA